jgi:DNA-binding cell septation regulator SpoVG
MKDHEVKFDPNRHQKVRYDGQLYVVIYDEFPTYASADDNFEVVLHPVCHDRVVHITSASVRKYLTVKKGSAQQVEPGTLA